MKKKKIINCYPIINENIHSKLYIGVSCWVAEKGKFSLNQSILKVFYSGFFGDLSKRRYD